MPLPDSAANAHDEAEALLAWYATGQLEGDERALVERHLASCVACQRQLQFDHRMIDELQELSPEVDGGWARLRARIEREEGPRHPHRAISNVRNLLRPAIAALVAAQLAFVIVAGGMLLSPERPQYRALGSPSTAAAANVIVIFRTDATQKQMLDLYHSSGASLVGGPTAADAYLLHVPVERRAAVLSRLQADRGVQMAQPIDGTAR